LYVELKSGQSHKGPAWIGRGQFNRSGKTVYFNGRILYRRRDFSSNHTDLETSEDYWISGVKKRGGDRHWAGGGRIQIDEGVVQEYLEIRGLSVLPKGYEIVTLNNEPAKDVATEISNEQYEQPFDDNLRFKEIHTLTDEELKQVLAYYENLDYPAMFLKNRKTFLEKRDQLREAAVRRLG
jgi:hypothetical protein